MMVESLTPPAVARRAPASRQLFAFLVVGGGAALGFMALSTWAVGLRIGVADWIVSAICYGLFIMPTYLAHRRLSFRSTAPHQRALPRYVSVQAGGLALATAGSFVAYRVLGLPALAASLLVIVVTSGLSFLALRLWAFAGARR